MQENVNPNSNLDNINCTKTILMLIIVAYHSMCFFTGKWFNQEPVFESVTIPIIVDILNSFHVFAFVLLSGYLFYYLKEEKSRYRSLKEVIGKKFKRLVIPYIFLNIFWVIPFYIKYFNNDIVEIVKRYVLGTSPNQLWFVLMLFWTFLITYVLWNLLTKNILFGAVTVGILFILGNIGTSVLPNVFQILAALKYVMFFWIGMMLRKYSNNFLYKIPSGLYIVLYLSVLYIYNSRLLTVENEMVTTVIDVCVKGAINIIGALMAFFVLNKISCRIKNNRSIAFIGKYSFSIYLFHQQIIYLLIDQFNGKMYPFTMVCVCFIVSLVCSLAISVLLSKNRFTRMCIGMK